MSKTCLKCGKELNDNAKFCNGCGQKQITENPVAPIIEEKSEQKPQQLTKHIAVSESQTDNKPATKPKSHIGSIVCVCVATIIVGCAGFGGYYLAGKVTPDESSGSDGSTKTDSSNEQVAAESDDTSIDIPDEDKSYSEIIDDYMSLYYNDNSSSEASSEVKTYSGNNDDNEYGEEDIEYANAKAKQIYTAALTYCTKLETEGIGIVGTYTSYDGTTTSSEIAKKLGDDLEADCVWYVKIENNSPVYATYSQSKNESYIGYYPIQEN